MSIMMFVLQFSDIQFRFIGYFCRLRRISIYMHIENHVGNKTKHMIFMQVSVIGTPVYTTICGQSRTRIHKPRNAVRNVYENM